MLDIYNFEDKATVAYAKRLREKAFYLFSQFV